MSKLAMAEAKMRSASASAELVTVVLLWLRRGRPVTKAQRDDDRRHADQEGHAVRNHDGWVREREPVRDPQREADLQDGQVRDRDVLRRSALEDAPNLKGW